MVEKEDNVYLKIGKIMYENISAWNFYDDYIVVNKKTYDDYKSEYVNKLNVQIELLQNSLNKIEEEINELERKNLELFAKITKNVNFKKFDYFKNSFFNLNNIRFIKSLDSEKYKLNLITINKLKMDRDIIYGSLEKTKSYKNRYTN